MSKVWNMMILIVGTTLLLKLAGLPIGLDWLFTWVGFNTNTAFWASNSAFWIVIAAFFASATAAGIIIGFFTKASMEWAILAPFASATMITFAGVFVAIVNYANTMDSWVAYLVLALYGIMGLGFVFALVEWVFNRSS